MKNLTLLEKKLMLKQMEFKARKIIREIYGSPMADCIFESFQDDVIEIISIAARDLKKSIDKELEKRNE